MIANATSPVSCLRPQPRALERLVCFAHAGGGPAVYRKWPEALAPDVELWAATLPGRAMRSDEPFATAWESLVTSFADQLEPDVTLYGHSLGGLLAFEVARELERRGVSPRHVFVSGCRPPHRVLTGAPLPEGDDALVSDVDERYGAVPPAVRAEPELLRRFVPVLRADLELAAAYEWDGGGRLACPLTALSGMADKTAPPREVAHWAALTSGPFQHLAMRGAHFFNHSELAGVATVIRRALI